MANKEPSKKSNSKSKVTPEAIVQAAVALATEESWDRITLDQVAKKAGITLDALHEHVCHKEDIVRLYFQQVDQKMLQQTEAADGSDESVRDQLFDVMMTHFEVLNQDRAAVKSMLMARMCQPDVVLQRLAGLCSSLNWMMARAGLEPGGLKGHVRLKAMGLLYVFVLRTWWQDDNTDMAKTMAVLDKSLKRLEQVALSFEGVFAQRS